MPVENNKPSQARKKSETRNKRGGLMFLRVRVRAHERIIIDTTLLQKKHKHPLFDWSSELISTSKFQFSVSSFSGLIRKSTRTSTWYDRSQIIIVRDITVRLQYIP